MPPKNPIASDAMSQTDIIDAIAKIDRDIAALLQSRIETLGKLALADDASKASQAINSALSAVSAKRDNFGASDAVFRAIDAACRSEVAPVSVAFLGPMGTYTHDAAVQHFGAGMQAIPQWKAVPPILVLLRLKIQPKVRSIKPMIYS